MSCENSEEKEIRLHKSETQIHVCPFTEKRGQKIGNVLISLMCFVPPLLILVFLLLSII